MKMKRVLSLLLALVMTMSLLTLPSYAADDDTAEDDFSALTVAEQYDALMAMEESDAEAVFYALTEEQQNELESYAMAQAAQETTAEPEIVEDIPAAVNYDKVAPISAGVIAKPAKKLLAKAAAPAAKAAPTNGISFDKTVTDKGNGTYTIKLEAYTTGTITTSSETKPCDIVLVLDRSTSMTKSFTSQISTYEPVYTLDKNKTYAVNNGYRYTDVTWCSDCKAWTDGCSDILWWHSKGNQYSPKTSAEDATAGHVQFYEETVIPAMNRMEALHYAANSFVSNVAEQSPDSRIAVVSFGQNAHRHTGNSNSTALLTAGSNLQTIKNAINGISADESATEHGRGMELAKNIFAASDSTGCNRVVVLITDGEPAPYDTDNWSSRVVKQTIENAYTMKHDYDAKVYCISVMPNTDASNPTSDMDKYMSYVSSNYPNARYTGTNLDNRNTNGDSYYNGTSSNIINQITPGSKIDTSKGSFYLTAGNIATLDSIFVQIATQAGGSTVSLDKSAVVRDVVTPYFNMPANSAVSAKSYDCLSYNDDTGVATWSRTGTDVTNAVSISGTTIDVSNFDFNRNFVAETGRVEGDATQAGNFHGRKLVITFDVTTKDGFLGGNGVPTNESAGVFVNKDASTPLTTATAKPVDVAIKPVTVTAKDKNVYLMGSLTKDDLMDGVIVMCGDVDITDPSKLQDWQTAFVTISDSANGMTNLTDNETYTVSATVSPETDGTAETKTGSATAKVNVFKPEVTFEDSTIYQGATPNYANDNYVSVAWKHGNDTANAATMGNAPELTYTYYPTAAAFTDCTPVAVSSVKLNGTTLENFKNHVKFLNGNSVTTDKQFTVHVLQPTITATVKDVQKYYGESYTLGDGANGEINVTWTDKRTDHSNIPAASGTKPYEARDLTLAYSTEAFNGQDGIVPNSDFAVTVKVMKGDTEMPDATITTSCTLNKDCKTPDNDGVYTVHVKTCTLTIVKSGCSDLDYHAANNTGNAEYQSFIFEVNGDEDNNVQIAPIKVTVQGNGEVKIVGLPTGTYTVTEDSNWSWRYKANGAGNVTLNAVDHDAEVTITNTREVPKWLSGDNYAVNHEGGIKPRGTFVGSN